MGRYLSLPIQSCHYFEAKWAIYLKDKQSLCLESQEANLLPRESGLGLSLKAIDGDTVASSDKQTKLSNVNLSSR